MPMTIRVGSGRASPGPNKPIKICSNCGITTTMITATHSAARSARSQRSLVSRTSCGRSRNSRRNARWTMTISWTQGRSVVGVVLKVVVLIDDAYFGLVFEPGVYTQSIFTELSDRSPNLLAVKIDGATKEDYVWGFRVGFLTYGINLSPTWAFMAQGFQRKDDNLIEDYDPLVVGRRIRELRTEAGLDR